MRPGKRKRVANAAAIGLIAAVWAMRLWAPIDHPPAWSWPRVYDVCLMLFCLAFGYSQGLGEATREDSP